MAKIRVSMHCGRSGSAKHNDRSFLADKSAEERREMAPHIREDAVRENLVWCAGKARDHGRPLTLEERELNFYARQYGKGIEKINERYRHEGHADRCRSIEDYYRNPKTRPVETIVQIGDRTSNVAPEVFEECEKQFCDRLRKWSREHNDAVRVLSASCHFDETSPHAHIRTVFQYRDGDNWRIGQNRALKEAGIELPDPSKAEGRYNNRKISFDRMARSMWQEICIEHGFDLELEPRPDRRHKDKEEFILSEIAENIRNAEQRETAAVFAAAEKENKVKAMSERLDEMRRDAEAIKAEVDEYRTDIVTKARDELFEMTGAERESIDKALGRAQRETKLEQYQHLEKRFPKEFNDMRKVMVREKHHDRHKGLGR